MLGPGYTPIIGEALGIEAPTPDPIVPGTVKPDIEAFPAAVNYQFSLVVSKRAGATMWDAYILRKGAAAGRNSAVPKANPPISPSPRPLRAMPNNFKSESS